MTLTAHRTAEGLEALAEKWSAYSGAIKQGAELNSLKPDFFDKTYEALAGAGYVTLKRETYEPKSALMVRKSDPGGLVTIVLAQTFRENQITMAADEESALRIYANRSFKETSMSSAVGTVAMWAGLIGAFGIAAATVAYLSDIPQQAANALKSVEDYAESLMKQSRGDATYFANALAPYVTAQSKHLADMYGKLFTVSAGLGAVAGVIIGGAIAIAGLFNTNIFHKEFRGQRAQYCAAQGIEPVSGAQALDVLFGTPDMDYAAAIKAAR